MGEEASTVKKEVVSTELQKEAVDALAQLKGSEQLETFDYLRSLIDFNKNAADTNRS